MGKTIILIESGKENYRSFTLDAMTRDGASLLLIGKDEPTWQKRFVSEFIVADPDGPQFLDTVVGKCEPLPIGGVATFVERLVPLAAELAQRLNVAGIGRAAAAAARDKIEMRRHFAQAGLWTPKQITLAEAVANRPADFRLPAVVKPVMGFASLNVLRIDDWSQLDWVRSVIGKENHPTLPDPGAAYLVEEYIDGPEFSVESCVSGDTIVHYAVTKKFTSPEPYFEEVAHVTPAPLPAADVQRLFETADKAIRALGLDRCATHTEIRLSPTYGPAVIEVAARLGGDKIPYLVELTTGASPSQALSRALLGDTVPARADARAHAGIVFFVPQGAGTVAGVVAAPPAVPGLLEFECSAKEGQRLLVPPDQFFTRLGYAIVEAPSYDEVRERMALVIEHVQTCLGVPLQQPA
jgi:biotin carboxylase